MPSLRSLESVRTKAGPMRHVALTHTRVRGASSFRGGPRGPIKAFASRACQGREGHRSGSRRPRLLGDATEVVTSPVVATLPHREGSCPLTDTVTLPRRIGWFRFARAMECHA